MLALNTLPGLTLDERNNGVGDVVFDATDASHVATGGIVGSGGAVPVMFELIPQARQVYNIIRKAQFSSAFLVCHLDWLVSHQPL